MDDTPPVHRTGAEDPERYPQGEAFGGVAKECGRMPGFNGLRACSRPQHGHLQRFTNLLHFGPDRRSSQTSLHHERRSSMTGFFKGYLNIAKRLIYINRFGWVV
jgi:hypothetical protein